LGENNDSKTDLLELLFPIWSLRVNNQPCLICPYREKCTEEIEWVNLEEDKVFLICAWWIKHFGK